MSRRTTFIVSILASLSLASIAGAQANPSQPGSMGQPGSLARPDMQGGGQTERAINQQLRQFAQDPKTACDKLFVLEAACANQFEIDLARQAQQKASNSQVKQVAQRIEQDHQNAQQQLQPIAQQLGVQIPTQLSEEKQQMIQILASLPSEDFDKHYIVDMQADHAKDLVKFRAMAELSQNDQVRRYAQQTLPALQQHDEQIMQAATALGLPTNSSEAVPAAGHISPGSSSGSNDMNRTDNNMGGSNDSGATGTGGRGNPTP